MEEDFRHYLKRKGKKDHVVKGLVDCVRLFENYLGARSKGIHQATRQDLYHYAATCESARKGSAGTKIRGVALYFCYVGNNELAATANRIREAGISNDRIAFKLKSFLWVNQAHLSRLKAIGIVDIRQMIESGNTPAARRELAENTGVPPEGILELVKLSDLARVTGVKGIRARLYHDAGLDTLEKIASLDVHELIDACIHFVEGTGFPGIPPTPKEAAFTVSSAKTLPRIVKW
ncbi:MAG: DUF4332 domain-containing protein [Dehalococcoidia bacterium]